MLTLGAELRRKAIHLLSAIIPVSYAAGAPRRLIALATGMIVMVALGVELARSAHTRSRDRFHGAVGILLRPHELQRWTGATWMALALLFAAVVYPRDVAIAAMWSVSVGDAGAAIIGRGIAQLKGRTTDDAKSLEGSAACLLLSALGAMLLARLTLGESLLVGVLAAAAERPRRPLDDNLRIVLAIGAGILLWRMALY